MNAEFQWWLLILGIVIGGALVYLVLADVQGDRTDESDDADETDLAAETPPAGTAATTPPGDAGRAGPGGSGIDRPDVEGDRAEAETPVADAH